MGSLFERFRPRTWSDVVGQEKAVAMLKRVSAGGKAFLSPDRVGVARPRSAVWSRTASLSRGT